MILHIFTIKICGMFNVYVCLQGGEGGSKCPEFCLRGLYTVPYFEIIPNSTSFRLAWCCSSNSEFLLELLGFDTDCWLSLLKNPITEGASELRLEVPAANENKQMWILDWIILKVERVWNPFVQLSYAFQNDKTKLTHDLLPITPNTRFTK